MLLTYQHEDVLSKGMHAVFMSIQRVEYPESRMPGVGIDFQCVAMRLHYRLSPWQQC
jgi:hypothetical protein